MDNNAKIELVEIKDIIPYENNPRFNDGAVEAVANSIKEFGFKQPLVLDKNKVIIAGHTRLKASKELGLKRVPCIIADDLTAEQVQAYRLADNKTGEIATWDFEMLSAELEDLQDKYDMADFGFEEVDEILTEELNPYTDKVEIPVYEPTGDIPMVLELANTTKRDLLVEKINKANIPLDIKEFLKEAANRHTVFDYSKIAEFYAHSDKEVQELFEDSALVIIDYERAIEKGYVKLSETIQDIIEQELGDGE